MRKRRYPSDMTDHEWELIEPLLPLPASETTRGGRPEKHPRREIVDAVRYVVDTGCKWRALPADFPPWRTVWGFMARWAAAGVISQIRDALAGRIRREMGRGPRAVATIIDSQSVRAASTVGKDSRCLCATGRPSWTTTSPLPGTRTPPMCGSSLTRSRAASGPDPKSLAGSLGPVSQK